VLAFDGGIENTGGMRGAPDRTVAGDKDYDPEGFVAELRALGFAPHIAPHTNQRFLQRAPHRRPHHGLIADL